MYLLLLLLIFPFSNVIASFDFKYGASLRSYPSLGGSFNSELGYNQFLYGEGNKLLFSLMRPYLRIDTSFVVSEYDYGLTFYPISFLAIGTGQKNYHSSYDEFTYYDCDHIRCEGNLKKNYVFGNAAFGYDAFLSYFNYSYYKNEYNDPDKTNQPVAEYQFILEVNPKKETQVQRTYYLGYQMDNITIGLLSDQHQFLDSEKDYQLNILSIRQELNNFKLDYGLGSLQSSDQIPGPVLIFRITHILLPSKTLL